MRGFERLLGIDWIAAHDDGPSHGAAAQVMVDVVGHDATRDAYYVLARPTRARLGAQRPRRARRRGSVRGRAFRGACRGGHRSRGRRVMLRFFREHPWYAFVIDWFVGLVGASAA